MQPLPWLEEELQRSKSAMGWQVLEHNKQALCSTVDDFQQKAVPKHAAVDSLAWSSIPSPGIWSTKHAVSIICTPLFFQMLLHIFTPGISIPVSRPACYSSLSWIQSKLHSKRVWDSPGDSKLSCLIPSLVTLDHSALHTRVCWILLSTSLYMHNWFSLWLRRHCFILCHGLTDSIHAKAQVVNIKTEAHLVICWFDPNCAQEPVIALHVRHGDKLKEANRLSVADYLRVVLPLAKVTCYHCKSLMPLVRGKYVSRVWRQACLPTFEANCVLFVFSPWNSVPETFPVEASAYGLLWDMLLQWLQTTVVHDRHTYSTSTTVVLDMASSMSAGHCGRLTTCCNACCRKSMRDPCLLAQIAQMFCINLKRRHLPT